MLGAVRFVNHSCSPNCEFVVKRKKKLVKFEILKNIEPYCNLTVCYGMTALFDPGNETQIAQKSNHVASSSSSVSRDKNSTTSFPSQDIKLFSPD